MEIIWILLIVAFAVLESVTLQLVSIWFAGGAVGGFIAALSGADTWLQLIVFAVLSAIFLVATKPILKKLHAENLEKTNTDILLGIKIILTETVDNLAETGAAKVNGITWTVRSADGTVLPKGTVVTVEKIEGVKLIVK